MHFKLLTAVHIQRFTVSHIQIVFSVFQGHIGQQLITNNVNIIFISQLIRTVTL